MVPPILPGTPAGFELATRILEDAWGFILKCDIDDNQLRPTPPKTVKHIEREMGKRIQHYRKCFVCGTSTRAKCNLCLEVYYCNVQRQKQHWAQHRLQCKAPVVAIEEHLCIAVPDYRCFWQYQHASCERAKPVIHMSVMVMSREGFADSFGADAAFRTILRLALTGNPSLYTVKTFVDADGKHGCRSPSASRGSGRLAI